MRITNQRGRAQDNLLSLPHLGAVDGSDRRCRHGVAPPADAHPHFGSLEVATASTILQSLTDAYQYLVQYPLGRVLSPPGLRSHLFGPRGMSCDEGRCVWPPHVTKGRSCKGRVGSRGFETPIPRTAMGVFLGGGRDGLDQGVKLRCHI